MSRLSPMPNTKKLFSKPTHLAEKATLGFITLIALWHLFLAGRVNLSVDEAHYALYGANLALSYFDHPPMVGWLNSIPLLFSHSDTALRVIPTLLFALSNWLLFKISNRLYPDFSWVGLGAVVLVNSAIMFQLLGNAMLPDSPLMVATLLVFWTVLNLRESPAQTTHSFKLWLQLGFWLGVAALSKYTAITLVASLLVIVILEKRWHWLKEPGLWAAIVLTSIMLLPVVIWNAQYDWISILYQLHHGTHNDNWDWLRVGQTQLAQLGVYSPLLYIGGLMVMISSWKAIQPEQISNRLLAIFALPTIILFALGSGYEISLPHWTQLAWLLISPGVVYLIWQHWQKKWLRILVILNFIIMIPISLIMNSQLVTPWIPFNQNENIVQELQGWPEAIEQAKDIQQQHPGSLLFAANWTQASRIAWYAYPQACFVTDNSFDQFDMWFGNPPQGTTGIVIVPSYESPPKADGQPGNFTSCHLQATLPILHHQIEIVSYHFYVCQNFQPPKFGGWAGQLPFVKALP